MKCSMDCFHCELPDCLLDDDDLTPEEIAMSEWLDNLAMQDSKVDSNMVIRTGKRGRPRKVFPMYENDEYKRQRVKKANVYYWKHKTERLEYAKKRWANMPEEQKEKELARQREYYRRRKCLLAKST